MFVTEVVIAKLHEIRKARKRRALPIICVCGHRMADHIEGFDPCSLCDCQEFIEAARDHDAQKSQ